jgi:O-methyltransferase
MSVIDNIVNFFNKQVDGSIINRDQITNLVTYALESMSLEGDVVEFGCYVGESSKYLMRTILESKTNKKLYCIDSFEGLPELGEMEKNSGWKPGTLKTNEDVITNNFIANNLPLPTIIKSWFKDVQGLPDKVCFAFLDGDFYSSIYESLEKIYDKVVDGGYIAVHDYKRSDLPGVEKAINDFFKSKNLTLHIHEVCPQLGIIRKNRPVQIFKTEEEKNKVNTDITLVTGIFDLNRANAGEGFKRPFEHYVEKFKDLLKSLDDYNVVVYIEEKHKHIVEAIRKPHNTVIRTKEVEEFKTHFPFYEAVQKIRRDENWLNQAGWLKESTQATMELYNPMIMSKMFFLHDEKIRNQFNTKYFYWIDGGLTNTVHPGYFFKDKVLDKLPKLTDKFLYITFPYPDGGEIHGFTRSKINELAQTKNVDYVCRAGFFGGHHSNISEINNIYYSLLNSTLHEGYMGTEESIFTLMTYREPHLFHKHMIEGNGLIAKFFEDLKNLSIEEIKITQNFSGTNLYVITFNSPDQFEKLIASYLSQPGFVTETKNYLLDNSTDLQTTPKYVELCKKYNFEHIKKENIGICGGRQFIAEHFDTTNSRYYMFLEDDMNLVTDKTSKCKNGLSQYTDNLFYKVIKIMDKEEYDFLKLSYTEFFGDNTTQWAWYNVPQALRAKYWPEKQNLPKFGLDPNAPKTTFKNIGMIDGLSYIDGEIYYCNWPQIVSRSGNKKMFIDTKWAHPFEQTWMSHIFQQTKQNDVKSAVLLLSPINHYRFAHYKREERREN